jgi:hypothetical protein
VCSQINRRRTKRLVLYSHIYIWVNTILPLFSTSSSYGMNANLGCKQKPSPEGKHCQRIGATDFCCSYLCSQRFCGIEKRKLFGPTVAHLLLKWSRLLSVAIYALYLAAKHAVKLSVHVSCCPACLRCLRCNWHCFWCVEIQCVPWVITYNPLGF